MLIRMLRRRPFLVTPWSIWIKPRLRIKYWNISFVRGYGKDERGRTILKIVDEMDREYWTRLSPLRFFLFKLGNGSYLPWG